LRRLGVERAEPIGDQAAQHVEVAHEARPLAPGDLALAGLQGGHPLVDLERQVLGPLLGRQLHAQPPLEFGTAGGDVEEDVGQALGPEIGEVLGRDLLQAGGAGTSHAVPA
jgi:hypothetical protein